MDLDKPKYIDAVRNLLGGINIGGQSDGPISKLRFYEEVVLPSEEDIQVKLTELISAWDAQEYARKREAEYPALAEQLDEIYHNGIDSWKTVIKVTKDKYPK